MQRILLALFSPCTLAMAQDPAADLATALLRRDLVTAARAVGSVTSPAARARLQAAMLSLHQRPAAMLAVATAFPGDLEADQALLAGAATAVAVLDRGEAVAGLAVWTEVEDDTRWRWEDVDALAPVV